MVIQFNLLQPKLPSVLYKTPLTQMATHCFACSELTTLVGIQFSLHHPVHRPQSNFSAKWLSSTARFKVNFFFTGWPYRRQHYSFETSPTAYPWHNVTNCLPVTQCHIPQHLIFFKR